MDLVPVAKRVFRLQCSRERFDDLLGGPCRSRVRGHVEVQGVTAIVSEQEEDKQNLVVHSWHDEKVACEEALAVVLEKRSPE